MERKKEIMTKEEREGSLLMLQAENQNLQEIINLKEEGYFRLHLLNTLTKIPQELKNLNETLKNFQSFLEGVEENE